MSEWPLTVTQSATQSPITLSSDGNTCIWIRIQTRLI